MNKWVKKIIIPLILFLLLPLLPLHALLPLQALAAGESVTAQIPFTVENAPGTVVIEAVTVDAPLPEKTEIENVTEGTFEITFTEVGEYYYEVRQKAGSQSGIVYDTETVYEVLVSVIFDSNGDLDYNLFVNKVWSPYKGGNIVFDNVHIYAYLDIKKTAKNDGREIENVFVNETFDYVIRVENRGQSAATNVTIIDALPRELPLLQVVKINDGGVMSSDGKYITWTFSQIAVGDSVTVSFRVRVPSVWGETSWVNTAAAIYNGGNPLNFGWDGLSETNVFNDWFGTDGLESWFEATSTATATSTSSATVAVPSPVVIIEKEQSLNGGARTKNLIDVEPGDTVMYYITVTNNSDATAADVIVTDDIPTPPMLVLIEDSISDGGTSDGSTITWNLEELDPGQSKTVTFKVNVPDVSQYTLWVNQAFGSYTEKTDSYARARSSERFSLISNLVEARFVPESGPGGNPTPGTPGSSGDNNPGTPSGTPQTGDNSHIDLWLILMLGSFIGAVTILFFFVKSKKKDEKE